MKDFKELKAELSNEGVFGYYDEAIDGGRNYGMPASGWRFFDFDDVDGVSYYYEDVFNTGDGWDSMDSDRGEAGSIEAAVYKVYSIELEVEVADLKKKIERLEAEKAEAEGEIEYRVSVSKGLMKAMREVLPKELKSELFERWAEILDEEDK